MTEKNEGQKLNDLMRNYVEAQKNLVKDNAVTIMGIGLVGTLGGMTLMTLAIVGVTIPPLTALGLGTAAAMFSLGFYSSKSFKEIFSYGQKTSKESSESKVKLGHASDDLADYLSNLVNEPEKHREAFKDVDPRLLNKIWNEHCIEKKKGFAEKNWDRIAKKAHSYDGQMKETFEEFFDKDKDFENKVKNPNFVMNKDAQTSSVIDAFKFAHGKNDRKSNLSFKEKITNGFKVGYGVANLAIFAVGVLATVGLMSFPIAIPGAVAFFCLTSGAVSLIKGVKDIKKARNLKARDPIIEQNREEKSNDLYEKIAGKTIKEISTEKNVNRGEITQVIQTAYDHGYHRIIGSLHEQDSKGLKRSLGIEKNSKKLQAMIDKYEDEKKQGTLPKIERTENKRKSSGTKGFYVPSPEEKQRSQDNLKRLLERRNASKGRLSHGGG